MFDQIEKVGHGSVIQHGKLNNRIYLMKLDKEDFPMILDWINGLAKENSYTKIFCKVPFWVAPLFISQGYIIEACIPKFYSGKDDAYFLSKFLSSDRLRDIEQDKLEEITRQLISGSNKNNSVGLKPEHSIIKLKPEDSKRITELYKQVFDSYPFPIFDPEYIEKTMNNGVYYYGIEEKGNLIALASSETDMKAKNSEMTDFATLPKYRGNNLSIILLGEMEKRMKQEGFITLYTIARVNSIPMNKTFLKLKYRYAGTLVKNTNISGKIESMGVYYKHI